MTCWRSVVSCVISSVLSPSRFATSSYNVVICAWRVVICCSRVVFWSVRLLMLASSVATSCSRVAFWASSASLSAVRSLTWLVSVLLLASRLLVLFCSMEICPYATRTVAMMHTPRAMPMMLIFLLSPFSFFEIGLNYFTFCILSGTVGICGL